MKFYQHGNKLFVEFYASNECPAYQLSDGRMVNETPSALAIDKREGSHLRTHHPDVKFGVTKVEGPAVVEIDIRELECLVYRASRNKNKRAQQGSAVAKFHGKREFIADFVPVMND